jgi:hypothetical protein
VRSLLPSPQVAPRKRRELSWEMVIVEAGDKRVGTAQAVAKSIEAASATGGISLNVVNSKGEGCDLSVPIPNKTAPVSPGPKQGCGHHSGWAALNQVNANSS